MLIATASLCGVPDGLHRWNATAVVTATSNWRHAPLIEDRPHLVLKFADIEAAIEGRRTGPRWTDVEAYIEFISEPCDRLLVHCAAGLSRSPALAIVGHMVSGMSADAACQLVARSVPEASPNRRILRLGGMMLGPEHALMEAAAESFGRNRGAFGARGEPTGLRIPEAEVHGSRE